MNSRPLDFDIERLYSLEGEGAVLGAMIIDPECISKVLPMLPRSESFYLEEHQVIYEALVKLYIEERPIDAVSLRDELKVQGLLAKLKGDEAASVQYIVKLMESVPSSANVVYYTKIVREREKEREVWSAIERIKDIPNEPGSVDVKIQTIQNIVLDLEQMKTGPDYVETSNIASEVLESMTHLRDDIIPTGFRDLDNLIHGFYPGELIFLAGRPSMGKSAAMLDMALNMTKQGVVALIISLEMTERALIKRAICNLAAIDVTRILSGEADDFDWVELRNAAAELQERKLILGSKGYTPEQVGGLIHRLKQTHNIGIVFVDYLQLMVAGKSESRQQEITEISRKLKAIALREYIPLVVVSQLNRQVDAREDHRPRMSDLRESGSLEQDGDLILFVYRSDYYRKNEKDFVPSGVAELIVSKNKRGPVGKAKLVFVHDYVKFSDLPVNYVGAE